MTEQKLRNLNCKIQWLCYDFGYFKMFRLLVGMAFPHLPTLLWAIALAIKSFTSHDTSHSIHAAIVVWSTYDKMRHYHPCPILPIPCSALCLCVKTPPWWIDHSFEGFIFLHTKFKLQTAGKYIMRSHQNLQQYPLQPIQVILWSYRVSIKWSCSYKWQHWSDISIFSHLSRYGLITRFF